MLPHRFLEEFQCGFLVSGLRDKAFQNFTLVVDRALEVVLLAIELHENLVEMPLPVARSHPLDLALLGPGGEHRLEPVPPKSNSFVADLVTAYVEQIHDVSQRKRKPHIAHHRQANDLGARLEILEGERLVMPERYRPPCPLFSEVPLTRPRRPAVGAGAIRRAIRGWQTDPVRRSPLR